MNLTRALNRFDACRDQAKVEALIRGQRAHARARLNVAARVVTIDGAASCTLVDVSCTGARLRAMTCPKVGALVVIERLPFELFGVVRWSGGGDCGIDFDQPLALDEVVTLRRYAEGEHARSRQAEVDHVRSFVDGTD